MGVEFRVVSRSEGVSSADITNSPNTNRYVLLLDQKSFSCPHSALRELGNATHVVGYRPRQGPGKDTRLYLDINPVLYQAE